MLLDSLRSHAGALRRFAALSLVRDMADRIRANPRGGVYYDTRTPPSAASACGEPEWLRHRRSSRPRTSPTSNPRRTPSSRVPTPVARVEYAPATGPATPARFLITLRWSDARNDAGTDSVALQVLAQSPVAG